MTVPDVFVELKDSMQLGPASLGKNDTQEVPRVAYHAGDCSGACRTSNKIRCVSALGTAICGDASVGGTSERLTYCPSLTILEGNIQASFGKWLMQSQRHTFQQLVVDQTVRYEYGKEDADAHPQPTKHVVRRHPKNSVKSSLQSTLDIFSYTKHDVR